MKLIIDIPEHIYEHAKETSEDSSDEFEAMRAIANGSPLPKGHGRLIDADRLMTEIGDLKKSQWYNENINGAYVVRRDAVEMVGTVCIKDAPTIIPAEEVEE